MNGLPGTAKGFALLSDAKPDFFKMKIKTFNLKDLEPAGYNPRTITPEALKGLEKSFEKFGYLEPLVVNVRDGKRRIISGHQRIKALMAQGETEAKCVIVDFDEMTEKAANIAMNSEAISGDWELEKLEKILEELKFEFPEFEEIELDKLDVQFDASGLDEFQDEDEDEKTKSEKLDFHECPKCGFKWEK